MNRNEQLEADVRAELEWDPFIDHEEIRVAAADGVVTLTGSVPSYAEKWAAVRAVERVRGVKAVANDLDVAVPVEFHRPDTDLAHAVVQALEWDLRVPHTKIRATVTNGWIQLDGAVQWKYQRDAAARAVRDLVGVRGVTNNIAIIGGRVSPVDVTRSITAALERRADRAARRIEVDAAGSVVTLRGTVPTMGDRRAAEGAAWSAPGVTDVRDELAIDG